MRLPSGTGGSSVRRQTEINSETRRRLDQSSRGVEAPTVVRVWHGEFRHPRLVEVYDALCLWSREDDFFLSVVDETPGARVVDLGCGTGRLTLALAAAGHRLPASTRRERHGPARTKPGAGG